MYLLIAQTELKRVINYRHLLNNIDRFYNCIDHEGGTDDRERDEQAHH